MYNDANPNRIERFEEEPEKGREGKGMVCATACADGNTLGPLGRYLYARYRDGTNGDDSPFSPSTTLVLVAYKARVRERERERERRDLANCTRTWHGRDVIIKE